MTMNHSEMEELLSAYADQELTPAQREAVELHFSGCPDCQRSLAEFRLVNRHLALLADPASPYGRWQPDVIAQVDRRIGRRRVWLGFGRRLATGAAGVLAVAALVVGLVWLLPRLSAPSPAGETSPTPTPLPASDEPGDPVTYIPLRDPQERATLQISSADLLHQPPAPGAVQNLGYRLILEEGVSAEDVLIVLEMADGGQTLLDPAEAPSIPVWPHFQPGDRLRLFLQMWDGSHSPMLEFELDYDAEGNWAALEPHKTDVEPSLRFGMPPSKSAYLPLRTPDEQIILHLFHADKLSQPPADGALQNLGYRLTSDWMGTFVVVEVVGGPYQAFDATAAPSIYPPEGAQNGDQVRLYAATSDGRTTGAAEFRLVQGDVGWLALNLHPIDEPVGSQVALPTPAAQVSLTPAPAAGETPTASLRLAALSITPEQPRLGEPFTVTAVIHNLGDSDVKTPTWFSLYAGSSSEGAYSAASSPIYYLTIPAGGQAKIQWDGQDEWRDPLDWSQQRPGMTFRAGVNVPRSLDRRLTLTAEADKRDNVAELFVQFLPYEPQVSDACPPGNNLWLELNLSPPSSDRPNTSTTAWTGLRVLVHNEGNAEVVRVPLRAATADGFNFVTYARAVPPCGGAVEADFSIPASQLSLPITVTLNPSHYYEAVPEGQRGDNQIVITDEDLPCVGPTDLWLTEEDVVFEGDDLLVTVHLLGKPPARSVELRVQNAQNGSTLATDKIELTTCLEPQTVRFEGVLAGLEGGYILVSLDPDRRINETVYPQHNNEVLLPLP